MCGNFIEPESIDTDYIIIIYILLHWKLPRNHEKWQCSASIEC